MAAKFVLYPSNPGDPRRVDDHVEGTGSIKFGR
jgi:hypothetical protein